MENINGREVKCGVNKWWDRWGRVKVEVANARERRQACYKALGACGMNPGAVFFDDFEESGNLLWRRHPAHPRRKPVQLVQLDIGLLGMNREDQIPGALGFKD